LSPGTPNENLSYINSLLPEAKLYIFTARRDYEVKEALNCSLQYTYVRKDTLKITDFADLLNPTTEKEDLDDSELTIE
jgi:hypothetical protein